MAGTMSIEDLKQDLRAMLGDAADKFQAPADGDFARHLQVAAHDLGRVRPRTLLGSITLTADQPNYAAPADLVRPKQGLWGLQERHRYRPWDAQWPGRLPRMIVVENAGTRELWLDPAPSAVQIAALGATYQFYYYAAHQVAEDEAQTTVRPADRELLLIRACAQAALELANRGVVKPVQFAKAMGNVPNNSTPVALHKALMEQFERMAA